MTTTGPADTGEVPTDTGEVPTGEVPTTEPFPGCDGVELAQDGVLDLNVPEVKYIEISGGITLNGGALPEESGSRGQLQFDYTPTVGPPGSVSYVLEASGVETYTVVLPAGLVTVRWVPDAALCADKLAGPLPCTGGNVATNIALNASGVLDLDIRSVVASGKLTQDGGPLPDADGDRGHLEFSRPVGDKPELVIPGGVVATRSFEASGPTTYEVALFPDTYDISFVGNAGLCSEGAAPVPCNRGVVREAIALNATGVLDVDVRRVEVGGAVKVNGAAMGAAEGDRGSLRFDPAGAVGGGGISTPAFDVEGPVDYAISLVAGKYTVALTANPGLCAADLPPTPTPCVGGPVLPSLDLSASGVLDVDIPMIEVGGKVTLAGGALPTEDGDRGSVSFARESGEAIGVALATEGPIEYLFSVMPGEYTISYAGNPALCDGVMTPAMPCSSGPLKTLNLAATGVLDVDVPVVRIAGKVKLNGGALPDQPTDRGSVSFTSELGGLGVALGTEPFSDYALTLLPGTYDVMYALSGECMDAPDNLMPCGGGRLATGVALANDGVLDVDIKSVTIGGAISYAGAPLPDLTDPRGSLRWKRADGTGTGLSIDLESTGPKQYSVVVVPGRWIVDHAANFELCEDMIPNFPCTDQTLIGCEMP